MKIFFDTNVVLDVTLGRAPFYINAEKLVLKCIKAKHTKVLSSLSVANIHYTAKKALNLEAANKGVNQILEHFEISTVNSDIVRQAHLAKWKDFEDAIQYFSALEAGVDLIVTRDVKGYEEQKVKVVKPEDALRLIN